MWTIHYRIGTLSGALELGESAAVSRHVRHLERHGAEEIRITDPATPMQRGEAASDKLITGAS